MRNRNPDREDDGMRKDIMKTMEALRGVSTERMLSCRHACPPPDRREVVRIVKDFQALLFPMCFHREMPEMTDEALLEQGLDRLENQLTVAMCFGEVPPDRVRLVDLLDGAIYEPSPGQMEITRAPGGAPTVHFHGIPLLDSPVLVEFGKFLEISN